ncbi:Transposon Ty3-G Gag-Pol polyprotein [Dictyocoela muelleri]|nr:Transposon Ty3-G Gag-Pol polyprotein [Dictyocoela muelleri]
MYSSPCFIKKKNDGTGRILVDYRNLIKISKKIDVSFPDIHETFHSMHGMKFFSKIDPKKGFYQIKINKNDQHKTAFATHLGKFEFTRIPFGLLNAPKFFHNVILEKLSGISNISVFVDDIIVFTKTEKDHLSILNKVFNRLGDSNIIINPDKSEFMKTKIKYLGFEISHNQYIPEKDRLLSLKPWTAPNTRRKLQKLLGEINWYRKFIPNLSRKLTPF